MGETLALPGRPAFSLRDLLTGETTLKRVLMILVCLWMTGVVILPVGTLLMKSLTNADGVFVGLANYMEYFSSPSLSNSISNSILVAVFTTLISVSLGFGFAYALTRSCMPGKGLFKGIAMMPLFAPTLLNGIALIYLFGRKGLISKGFFGLIPGLKIPLYGPVGIVISEVMYTFPQAMLILTIALSITDARLYEAARSLGAGSLRIFFTVTLPSIKYGLLSAVFVCFILAFTDFGAPKVVGGNFNILATDIYKQVIGQQNFVMGAVVSVVLLIPTLIAFIADRMIQGRQAAMIAAKSVPLVPEPKKLFDTLALAFCSGMIFLILSFYATALFASLVKVWPYKLDLGLWHYHFSGTGGGGYAAFFNSIRMSFYSAVFGTVITFSSAYLIEKIRIMKPVRQTAYFLSILPLALPGLVIGLSYIFFFNARGWEILGITVPNPFNFLYATMGILVLSNIVHFYTVSFLSATTALKQLDIEFEQVSESMAVPFYKTFFRVSVPACLPAVLEIAIYYFVNSMATVSAVIFLYSADIPLASVAIANMDDAGDIAPACAMSMLVVLTNILVRLVFSLVTAKLKGKSLAWTKK
ncbi:putative 2-aminoethylphosphonate ABC transporter permease subunit [Desulfospira joergensenii]|uniref:putative 2-aminoethylphosphonate ABC transporter permease subunit n=1 Tax=Desulfospira joergensenii TaxID=53329 RepID=UPI00041D48B1|nr:putative 2-aminoethylphosphonate ABC transporter permease subunit [Desulfospira joergensenii]